MSCLGKGSYRIARGVRAEDKIQLSSRGVESIRPKLVPRPVYVTTAFTAFGRRVTQLGTRLLVCFHSTSADSGSQALDPRRCSSQLVRSLPRLV